MLHLPVPRSAPTRTSQLLEELVARAPDGPVDLEWLLSHLDRRSFGLLLLLLGLLVIVPGVATVATLALLFPAVEMMLGHSAPSFPRFLSKRPFDFKRFKRFTVRAGPLLRAIENISRPRWNARHDVTDRLVGLVVFLLGLLAGWPLPLVNVIPGDCGRSDRDRLPAGRWSAVGRGNGGRGDVLAWPWMDALDVGRGRNQLDRGLKYRGKPPDRCAAGPLKFKTLVITLLSFSPPHSTKRHHV
ncbi:hypothetical protein ABIF24_001433 [Bradyrhizobium elkanii]|uniref:exopolysaccharide biosynthesis protein n=1 Tax=Bradyrhizobium elkanii TaxID=29448 RepID=UPI0035157876